MRRAGVPARNRGGHFTEWKQRGVEDEHCPSRHQPQAREPEWRPAGRLHVLLISGEGGEQHDAQAVSTHVPAPHHPAAHDRLGRHAATEVQQQRNSDDKRDDNG